MPRPWLAATNQNDELLMFEKFFSQNMMVTASSAAARFIGLASPSASSRR